MRVKCLYNNPDKLPAGFSSNFSYGLELNKTYLVMGIRLFKGQLSFLIDESGYPNWFPTEIFELNENSLPYDWYFKFKTYPDKKQGALWGFKELCDVEDFYDLLIERDMEVMAIYFKRKSEFEMQ